MAHTLVEASCLLAAGKESKLLEEKKIFKGKDFPKIKSGAVTIAVAESKNQYYPTNGEIHIIGSGPGDISFITNDAKKHSQDAVFGLMQDVFRFD